MSKEENKDYYRINEPDKEDPESEMATGEKRSKKKLIIIISVIVVVVAAITALLLILLLKKDDNSLPSGYNGFVLKQNKNLKYAYWARINRENDASVPIEFGSNNKEFVEVDFNICMYSDRTYRISYTPTQNAIGSNDTRWTVPDELLERKGCDNTKLLSFGDFSVDQNPFGFTLKNPAHKNTFWLSTKDRNLVLSDKYIECGFEIHSQQVFGWGERTRDFMLVPGEYSIWNTGIEKRRILENLDTIHLEIILLCWQDLLIKLILDSSLRIATLRFLSIAMNLKEDLLLILELSEESLISLHLWDQLQMRFLENFIKLLESQFCHPSGPLDSIKVQMDILTSQLRENPLKIMQKKTFHLKLFG